MKFIEKLLETLIKIINYFRIIAETITNYLTKIIEELEQRNVKLINRSCKDCFHECFNEKSIAYGNYYCYDCQKYSNFKARKKRKT